MKVISSCPICDSIDLVKSPAVVMPFITYRIFGWEPKDITADCGLKSINCGTSYQVCASCFCLSCHLLFSDLRFDQEEMSRLYEGYRGARYLSQRTLFEPDYEHINSYLKQEVHYLDKVEALITAHRGQFRRVLDWGGGDGLNTPLKARASELFILDISEQNHGRKTNGLDVISSLEGKNDYFDLVVAMHVFEHLSAPSEAVKLIADSLVVGGLLYLEVPLEPLMQPEGLSEAVVYNKHHWHEHINFFSSRSLAALIATAGLEQVEFGWMDVTDDFRSFQVQFAIAKKTSSFERKAPRAISGGWA